MANLRKAFSSRELSDFCSQLTMILNAGMSLPEGLDMMQEDSQKKEEKEILSALQQSMEQSGIFSEALTEAQVFPEYMVKMIALGEETGHLDDVMASLADHYDREDSLTKSIRSAVAYPLMMLGMMVLIILVLLTKVMPIFNQVFQQLGTELSGLSRGLMNLGTGIRQYGLAVGCILVALVIAGIILNHIPKGKATIRCIGEKIPLIRIFHEKIALVRFCSGMALALSSGLNPEYALDLVKDLSQDPVFRNRLETCRQKLEEGDDFSHVLLEAGLFSGIYARMATIGQRTGTMDQTMRKIADDCQEDLDQKIAGALSMIEPALVVILSIIVGVILMSVMFPLLGILSSI